MVDNKLIERLQVAINKKEADIAAKYADLHQAEKELQNLRIDLTNAESDWHLALKRDGDKDTQVMPLIFGKHHSMFKEIRFVLKGGLEVNVQVVILRQPKPFMSLIRPDGETHRQENYQLALCRSKQEAIKLAAKMK